VTRASAEDLAAALDGLAEQVLANLAPLSFDTARTAADVDAVLRMRYECVIEMGWGRPEDFPDGRERDEYDEGATFVVCRDGPAIVGSHRLVWPEAGRPLPLEREFGILIDPPGEAADAGRLVIAPDYRGLDGHPVLAGLVGRCWLEARRRGYSRVVAGASSKLIDIYTGVGVRITVLGPSKVHWGEERTPVEIAGREDTFAAVAGG
jgi:N-acyl-L-homoserine lactone synthetase